MKEKEKGTNINFLMSPKCSEQLKKAAVKNGRSKRQEAAHRLEHHLTYFSVDWVEKGK